jgi:BirA family transcriptional regulator, biotin operon repressor / biotin---[acetyl-CoA-carboxylase] ligase
MGDLPSLPKGTTLHSFECLDSTNSAALRLIASDDAGEGTVVVAERQTAGRGRRDAVWESPTGNLYLTIVTKVPNQHIAGQLAYVASLAVYDVAIAHAGTSAAISCKWPNDLLLHGKKLAGILIEALNEFSVVGIGLNLSTTPSAVADKAISLADIDLLVDRSSILSDLIHSFDHWVSSWRTNGFSVIRDGWLAVAHGIGRPIIARFPDGTEEPGKFQGIDGTGALVLERVDGSVRMIAAAEIFFSE